MSERVLSIIRDALRGTEFESKVYLVGGCVRDRLVADPHFTKKYRPPQSALPNQNDIDLVYEGDVGALASALYERGISAHRPVIYAGFRTAMLNVCENNVELVGARKESYTPDSRKPLAEPGTLQEDAFRRDFTINTLMENLHTGELLDLTGQGIDDLRKGILRTPLDPERTFSDDPLRMMRAVRFAARFAFTISEDTLTAINANAGRLQIVSAERVRDEFIKIIMSSQNAPGSKIYTEAIGREALQLFKDHKLYSAYGLELLRETGLLKYMPGALCIQEIAADNDNWFRSLLTVEYLADTRNALLRLAGLLCRQCGRDSAAQLLKELKFSNKDADYISLLLDSVEIANTFVAAGNPKDARLLIHRLKGQIDGLVSIMGALAMAESFLEASDASLEHKLREIIHKEGCVFESPISGFEIMHYTGCSEGIMIGEIKKTLTDMVLDGEIKPGDRIAAKSELQKIWNDLLG